MSPSPEAKALLNANIYTLIADFYTLFLIVIPILLNAVDLDDMITAFK